MIIHFSQAVSFVMSHREAFILLLKDNSFETSLPLLREQQLIVLLSAHFLPALQMGELVR
jgi:hypothetical protein